MNDRYKQVYKIYKKTKNKDVRLYCVIYFFARDLR
nr:MAG TPA: hypothetical protein [Caudoviricetes sp.]